MRRLATDTLSAQNIASDKLVYTYTADADRSIYFRVLLSGIAGNDNYTAYLTIQLLGAGSAYRVVPIATAAVASGVTAAGFTTIAVPVKNTDVVKVYVKGVAADTSVGVVVEVWDGGLEEVNVTEVDGEDVSLETADSIASAVWSATTRTLTSLSSLVASIAAAVWAYATRTLTGSVTVSPPSAYTEDQDIYYNIFKNCTRAMSARVRTHAGVDLTQATVTSITYSVYKLDGQDPDTRTAVTGHSVASVTVADVIYDTLQTDDLATNWNFRHVPPIATNQAFTKAGADYLVEYTITPTTGQKVILRFRVACI